MLKLRLFLSKSKRDEWIRSYLNDHHEAVVASGNFLCFYTAYVF